MPRRAPVRPARRPMAPVPARPAPRRAPQRWWLLATTALLPVTGTALAQTNGPAGGQVVAGQAAIAQTTGRTTITQSTDRAAIDWQQFNVGSQHTVQFVQPSQGSWTLNRVVGPDPSVIAGRVQANGGVAIVNQSGVVFAQGAQVDVGSLIASAANITNNNFMAGRMVFDGAPRPGARVENRGTITVADRGLAALVGPGAANSGVIRARLGRVALGAAETFVLDLAGDGLIGIDVTQAVRTAPEGATALVTNSGVIQAPGGSVLLTANAASGLVEDLVRNTGRIEAPTLAGRRGEVALRADGGNVTLDGTIIATGGATERGGAVALQATGQVTVGAAARIDASGGAGGGRVLVGTTGRGRDQTMAARTTIARGAEIRADATANGNGGEILVNSTDRTEMRGTLSARGGEAGGNGGFIEVSGQGVFVLDGIIDLRAPNGELGEFLLDPRNIFIADSGTAAPGTVTETPDDLTTVGGSVTGAGAVSATTGANGEWVRITPDVIEGYSAGNITLEASRQIVVADAVNRTTEGDLTLRAGLSGSNGTITQRTGADISVNGVLTLETGAGNISLGADLRATGVVLSASGNISQAGGSIAHRIAGTELPLTVTASGGSSTVSLIQAGNGPIALAASSAGGDFSLAGESIRVTGTLDAAAIALTATTGAIALDADVRATEVNLAAVTGISQGGGTLEHRDGAATALPLTATVSGTGDIVLNQANGALQLRGGGTANGALSVTSARLIELASGQTLSVAGAAGLIVTTGDAGTALALNGALYADSVSLTSAGSITQAAGGVLARRAADGGADPTTALPLTVAVTGEGHAVSLVGNNGRLSVQGASTEDGNITLRSRGMTIAGAVTAGADGGGRSDVTLGVTINGAITARNAFFNVAGAVTQTVALDLTGRLRVRGVGGGADTSAASIDLTLANALAELDARATGALAVTMAGAATVTQARGAGIALTGGALTVSASGSGITGTGAADVSIVADSLTGPGTVTAPDGRTISLRVDALDLSGGTVSAGATGTVEIGPRTDGHAVQVGTAGDPAATLELAPTDLAAITAGTLRLGRTTIGGSTLTANGLSVVEALTTTANLTLLSAGGINVQAALTGPTLRLEASSGDILLGAVPLTANGASASITLLTPGAITQDAGGALVAPDGTDVALIAHAPGGITLFGEGDFTLAGGLTPSGAGGERSLYAADSIGFTTTGALTVASTVEATAVGASVALGGGSISVEAPVTTDTTAGSITLTATGEGAASTITQTAAGVLATRTLNLAADGAIDLAQAANVVGTLGTLSFNDAFGYRSSTGFTVSGPLAPTDAGDADITIIADTGNILVHAPIGAGNGTVRLTATAGDIDQADTGAGITAGRLEVAAAGDALLAPTDGNAVAVLGGSTVGGTLAFRAAGDLALDGPIGQSAGGGTVRIDAGGALTLNAGATLGFDTITLNAQGLLTLGGTLGVDQAVPVSLVRLGAAGGITQEATGRIVASSLGIRATGDVLLTAGANDVRLVAATTDGVFALDTHGALATGTVTAVPLWGEAAASVSGVLGSSVTLSADALTINAAGLAGVNAGVHASAADGVLTLRADTLTLNAYAAAGDPTATTNFNGTIAVAPRTLGRAVVLGGADAAALSLTTLDLARLVARNLVIGRSEIGAGTLTVAGAVAPLTGVNSVLLQGGGITLNGTFTLATTNGLLTLSAVTGDIVQGAGSVSAARLFAEALSGSVRLDGITVLNQVAHLAGEAAEDFAFRGAGSYAIAAPGIVADGTVTLLAPSGGITQGLGAPIVADRLVATAFGAVVLDGGGATAGDADLNRVATLGPSSGTSLTFRNAGALRVEGATANGAIGSTVVLEAPQLTLAGDVVASTTDGRVILRTGADFDAPEAGTAITQTAGVIRTRDLSASAGDEIALTGNNEVTRLAAGAGVSAASTDSIVLGAGGDFSFTDAAGGVQVAARVNAGTGSAVRVVADGLSVAPALSGTVFYAPGGVVRFLPFTAGATIGLGGSGDTTNYAASLLQRVQADRLVIGSADAGDVTLRQALDLTGANGPLALELHSGGDILAGGYALSLRAVSAYAAGDVVLGNTASAIQHIAAGETRSEGIVAGGTVSVATAGTLAVDAPIEASGASVTLTAADFVLASGATVTTGALPGALIRIVSTNAAGLALGVAADVAGLSQAEIALLDARGGTLRLEGSAITFAGTVAVDAAAAGLLDLSSAGAVTQTGGTLAAAALRADAASIQIDRAGNSLPRIQATATGDIAIATGGATTVLGTRSTGGDVTITADSIALSDAAGTVAVRAADTVSLTATNGDITGSADLAAVQATTLNATATGAIALTGDNAVGTLAAVAGTGVTFENTTDLTAGATGPGGTAIAGNVALTAPSLRLNDVLATGTVALNATAGSITQATGVRLAAGTLRADATGAVTLDAANGDGTARNEIADIDALSAGTDITLRNALALTIDLPLSVGADRVLTLEAPSLVIGDSLSAGTGGRIVLRTGSFNGGAASGGDITQTGGTISTPLLAALAGGAISLDRAGNAIGSLGGGRSAAGADLGLGLVAGTSGVVRSTGFGGNASLGVTGALDIGSGGSLLLRADDFAIAAAIRVPDGTITLLPVSTDAGIGYVLGGAAGSTHAGRITLDSTELSFFPTGTPAAELILGALGVTGSVDIEGTVSLATGGGTPRVNQLTLVGDGSLTQAAGTSIDVAALRAIFPNGTIRLDPGSAGNRIAALAGIVAGGDISIRGGAGMMTLRDGGDGTAIRIGAAGHSVTLRTDDLDIQAAVQAPAGVINLLPETVGRTVTLGGTGSGTLALSAAEIARLGGGGAALNAPAATRLRIGSDGTLRTAGDILVTGDVPLRGRVGTLELVAGQPGSAGGSVRQSGGSVDVATVTGTAQGDFRLGLSGNAFDTATGIAAGTLPAAGATGVVELATGGSLTATDITAPVSVRLSAGAALSAGAVTAPAILLQGGTVRLTELIQGSDSVAIESTGAVSQDAGALIVTGLFTLNGSSILLPEENEILELNGLVATGPVLALKTVLPMLVSGTVTAVGSLSFITEQGLTVAEAGSITVTGGPGTADLQAGGAIDYRGGLTTTGAATLTAGGLLAFSGIADIGGALTLGAGAGMTLGGSITAGGRIGATAIGALTSTGTLAAIDGLDLTASTDLSLGGTWSAGGAARFAAGGLLTYTAAGEGSGDVTLTTPGAISAEAGSGITAGGTLRLDAGTDLTARGSLAGGPLIALNAGTGDMTLAGTIAADGAVTGTAGGDIATGAVLTAGGAVSLTADGTLNATNRIEAGGALTLGAGAGLSLGGTWSAGAPAQISAGGLLTYTATGVGTNVTLTTPGAILAEAGSSITASGTLRLDGGTGLTARGSLRGGPLVALDAGTGDMTLAGTIAATGAVTGLAGGAIATDATLTAGGAVSLSAGGALTATRHLQAGAALTLGSGAGMTLGGTWSAGGPAAFTTAGTLTYRASGTGAADVTLGATGAIGAEAGSSIVGTGAVRLNATTSLSAQGTISGGPLVALTALTGTMSLSGSIAATGAIPALAGAGLPTTAVLNAGGDATLTAGGVLAASNSLVAGGALRLGAGGDMTIGGIWSAGGLAAFTAGGAIILDATGTAGGAVRLATPGSITASAGSRIVTPDGIDIEAGSDLAALGTLSAGERMALAAHGAMTLGGTIAASGEIAASAGGALTTDATISGQAVSLTAGGLLSATNRISVTNGRLTLRGGAGVSANGSFSASADATLAADGGALALAGSLAAGGAIGLNAAGALRSTATVQAGQGLTITSGGDMALDGLHRAGTALSATAGGTLAASGTVSAGQDVSLRAGQAMLLSGFTQAGAALAAQAGGALTQAGTAQGATVALTAGGMLTQTGTVSAAGRLALSASGDMASSGTLAAGGPVVLVAGGGLAQSGLLQAGEAANLSSGGALSLTGQATAATDLTLTAGGAATLFDGKVTAGRAVRLTAGQGIELRSFQIDPTLITLRTDGTLLVAGSTLTADGRITLAGGTVVLRGNSITADTVDVDAGGTLTLDGGRYVIERAVAFSAPGGITTPSTITVAPRGGLRPAVVFDTRAAGALPDPLEVVEPDTPGVPNAQQPTQVRIPGTEVPGAFGPASSAAAGPMQIDIDAGRSAIFLLLDGGTATGTIVSAGRLAIHGTGGSAELTGELIDISGSPVGGTTAARFADSTRPAATGALTRYRLNGCVLSSVNCVVPSQVLIIPQAPPQRVDIRLGGGAITDPDVQLPNIAEEDY